MMVSRSFGAFLAAVLALPAGAAMRSSPSMLNAAAGFVELPRVDENGVPEIGVSGAIVVEPRELRGDAPPPTALLDLGKLFSRQWKTADSFEGPEGKTYLSATFDLDDDMFLSVIPPGWKEPLYYRFEYGMSGAWRSGGEIYRVKLEVNIFRERTRNWIIITRDGQEEPVYKRRIQELGASAYAQGDKVVLAGRAYRVFFDYNPKGDSPARIDPTKFGVVFVHDADSGEGYDFHHYAVDYNALKDGKVHGYRMHDEQKVGLRVPPNTTDLEVYDLSSVRLSEPKDDYE